jgi:hypothetical protein
MWHLSRLTLISPALSQPPRPSSTDVTKGRPVLTPEAVQQDVWQQTAEMRNFVRFFASIAAIMFCGSVTAATAVPHPVRSLELLRMRDDGPAFPSQPPSCPICAQNYGNIDSCAQAAPVLANVSMVWEYVRFDLEFG